MTYSELRNRINVKYAESARHFRAIARIGHFLAGYR